MSKRNSVHEIAGEQAQFTDLSRAVATREQVEDQI